MGDVLEPGVVIKPCMDKIKAIQWAWELFGLKATNVKEFNSYDDRNFFFKVDPDSEIDNPNLSKEAFLDQTIDQIFSGEFQIRVKGPKDYFQCPKVLSRRKL